MRLSTIIMLAVQRIGIVLGCLAIAGIADAQLVTSLKISKKMHLTGEPVAAVLSVTNHSGRELVFRGDGRFPWLHFSVTDGAGQAVQPMTTLSFPPMKIAAGQTLAREVDLAAMFQLDRAGSYSVSATIQSPLGDGRAYRTNRAHFVQSPGRTLWTQTIGRGGSGRTREFRLIQFTGDTKSRVYAQVFNHSTGRLVGTLPLGDAMSLRKPAATVDREQRMHALFMSTPSIWSHCVIDAQGKVVDRQFHKLASTGDPRLVISPDGSVQVVNSAPYDPKAEAERRSRIRKLSERPPIPI
jgi:hypothetical protein